MVSAYYLASFLISFALTLVYAYKWHRHFDLYTVLMYVLIPLVNLAYVFLDRSTELQSALNAQKIIYIGGCFLIYFIMFSIFNLCDIRVSKPVRTLSLVIISVIYLFVLTIGEAPYFYTRVSLTMIDGRAVLDRSYGPVHTIFYILLVLCFVLSFLAIFYSYIRKKQVSRTILYLVFLPEAVCFISFFAIKLIRYRIELMPAAYIFAQVMYLLIAKRMCLYDISDTVVDSIIQAGEVGFVSVDFKNRYLGSNDAAKRIMPELCDMTVDRVFSSESELGAAFMMHLEEFKHDEQKKEFLFAKKQADEDEERIYKAGIQYLYDDRKKRGYQFVFEDDTQSQKYITLINHYNTELEREVDKKTRNLIEMHNKLILSMATMVESRDNSTGGHIRRTSEGVRILIGEMRKDPSLMLTDKFCADIIKAAPMHDLGKIAVDDSILRKPGRFTDEEFAQMKKHAAEGARIVHEILEGTEDESFRKVAENVAHYHHERWDGSGYPEGLKGTEIPFEARIMAIADVYDALVSKRVYKEKMSFEKADEIIMEGMGKHFDKMLEPYYIAARPSLEAYYTCVSNYTR